MATQDETSSEQIAHANTRASTGKPKRVRTGCLTCRERHLKCDEGLPTCLNCRKSGRECKRGVRLNFIDTQCQAPPFVAPNEDWNIAFQDDSREIASEYQNGLAKYAPLEQHQMDGIDNAMTYEVTHTITNAPALAHQSLPSLQGMSDQQGPSHDHFMQDAGHHQSVTMEHANSTQLRHPSLVLHHHQGYEHPNGNDQQDSENHPRDLLDNAEETLYMQVFVEEVGAWMDAMDNMKHFSRVMPFHALREPMLLNAFLACGSRHLTLVNPGTFLKEDNKALEYYDRASRLLLRALQNPNRDSVICATTAVILNVYEIMTEKALPRMNHIAGARALIKECGWSARSSGIGAACFWLNVGLETMSNLRFNWQSSWNPDDWGLDLDLTMESELGREESWTLRMLYIIAKVNDFRATIPKRIDASPQEEQARRHRRFSEWCRLKIWADEWEHNSPRTMKPMAYMQPWQNLSRSNFPDIWIIKRTSVVGRLLYHNAMVLLAQINPMATPHGSPYPPPHGMPSPSQSDLSQLELYHAHQICGIVAHVKDRGVASVALRCLHHAAECLTVRREQEEVLEIFTRIHKDTGWRIHFIPEGLMKRWGWSQNEMSATLNGLDSPATQPAHSAQMQAAAAMAAVANAASGGMNVSSMNGMHNGMAGATSPIGLGLGAGGGIGQSNARFQFDQYAEVQNWKRNQQHQRQGSLASQASQRSQHSQPPNSAGLHGPLNNGGQQQTSPQQIPPQGIVNPMYQQRIPPTWQGYYVSPDQRNDLAQARATSNGGLGLSLENGFSSVGPEYS